MVVAAECVVPSRDSERRHIALIGFMGAGKTSVGKALAARLGLVFVDLDELITLTRNKTIPEIFRESGEVGFRAFERAALRDVLGMAEPVVMATGGGTFVDAAMRELIQRSCRSVYLKASLDVLAERALAAGERDKRPLLHGADPVSSMRRLLQERTPAYEECSLSVNTEGLDVAAVVDRIVMGLRYESKSSGAPVPEDGESSRTGFGAASSSGVQLNVVSGGLSQSGDDASDASAVGMSASGVTPRTEGRSHSHDDWRVPLKVESSHGVYAVEMRPEAGTWLAERIGAVAKGNRIAVITDRTVGPLHGEALVADLRALGLQVSEHEVEPGEGSKSWATAGRLYDILLADGFGRRDTLVALGGGVVGDLTGFVAATLLRGVAFVQVPTTTLAAIDSSVGGKTGINTSHGKNLVGAFYAPKAVLVAGDHLRTQSRRGHVSGLVEALKIAATCDAELFEMMAEQGAALVAFATDPVLQVIRRAVGLKAGVVERDEREAGERAVLNYGHTVGHAIEAGADFKMLHGEAVALGMVAEAEWAQQAANADSLGGEAADGGGHPTHAGQDGAPAAIVRALHRLGAPTDWRQAEFDAAALRLDKKRLGQRVRMPVVSQIGTYVFRNVPMDQLVAYVERERGVR